MANLTASTDGRKSWTGGGQPRERKFAPPRIPADVEFGIVLVQLLTEPDELGRVTFYAYWHADYIPSCDGKVRGQVFVTRLDAFAEREAREGRTVTVMDDEPGSGKAA